MTFATELSAFAATAAAKLRPGIGEPEDQIRAPFEHLLTLVGVELTGLAVNPIGEAALSAERIRPDYALLLGRNPIPVGFVELKAPGLGADTARFRGRNRVQWERLSALPNVVYTDGNEWVLYRSSEAVRRVRLIGDIRDGRLEDAGGELQALLSDFLLWDPPAPRNTSQLVRSIAGLTRLLRDEVFEEIGTGGALDALAADWRGLLFPDATDAEFADGYAQAVTFALLLARAEGIDFAARDLSEIARLLGKTHSLMGKALSVLTDQDLIGSLYTSVMTLVRVAGAVDWERITDRGGEPWLMFYESFLEAYDNELRKASGSYYTPGEVVAAMVRLTNDVLVSRLDIPAGFTDDKVVVVDPAMGTGTYLLELIRSTARRITELEGPGAVGPRLRSLTRRLIGFEKQVGPYAVSELRAFTEFQHLGAEVPAEGLRLFVTDSLGNPFVETTTLSATLEPIARSRREANKVKATEPVMVVIGNPPYKDKAGGLGGWVEAGDPGAGVPPWMDSFREPGNGKFEYVQSNLYVYFWRWALWKVFEAHPANDRGVVAFITAAGWLSGPGFKGMRRHLREIADEVWVIDCTPEGHRPEVPTRLFPGVQQPLAIVIAARRGRTSTATPARVMRTAIHGRRGEKFEQLGQLQIDGEGWVECSTAWTAPFAPASGAAWDAMPALADILTWASPGVKPNRTWPYAPRRDVLEERWAEFIASSTERRRALLGETRDRSVDRLLEPFPGIQGRRTPLAVESGPMLEPVRVGFRVLDRQWAIPDIRLMDTGRPDLWATRLPGQIYFTEQHAEPIEGGPALGITADIPDMHHYNGRGGRVLPLLMPDGATNILPGLLDYLSGRLEAPVNAEDLAAYLAAIVSNNAFAARFRDELVAPGIHVPLTTDALLWQEAVTLGYDIVGTWTFGERMSPGPHRAAVPPRVMAAIPDTEDGMPVEATYDAKTETLCIGDGRISPVRRDVWEFEVSTYRVVQRWLKRRLRVPEGKRSSELDNIVARSWSPDTTTELLAMLNAVTLLIDAQPRQADLLERVMVGPLVTVEHLTAAGVLPVRPSDRRPPKRMPTSLFDVDYA